MKKKKIFKKIIANVLFIVIALSVVEAYCFYKTKTENEMFQKKADRLESNNTRQYKTKYKIFEPFKPEIYRKSFIKENTNKKPILWFGCSFAEGAGLEDNKTPCYKISELTGRSCINHAKGATGTQFMYYQLANNLISDNAQSADYIIYTFIWNHIQRLYNFQINPLLDVFNTRYKISRRGELEEIKPVFKPIYSSFFIRRVLNKNAYEKYKEESYNFNLFNKLMQETIKITKERYPNSKFILLEFPDLSKNELPEYEIKNLKEMGINVIKVTDLTNDTDIYDKKYWLADEIHPSEELWDIILPKVAKEYINED